MKVKVTKKRDLSSFLGMAIWGLHKLKPNSMFFASSSSYCFLVWTTEVEMRFIDWSVSFFLACCCEYKDFSFDLYFSMASFSSWNFIIYSWMSLFHPSRFSIWDLLFEMVVSSRWTFNLESWSLVSKFS